MLCGTIQKSRSGAGIVRPFQRRTRPAGIRGERYVPRPTSGGKRGENRVETTEISFVFAKINEKKTSRADSFDGPFRKTEKMIILKGALEKLHAFLTINDRDILANAGRISHELAKEKSETEYEKFQQQRVRQTDTLDGEFEKYVKKLNPPGK